jgi:phosphoglycolate phosphatase
MIGIKGEVYPIKKSRFDSDYTVINETYSAKPEYIPSVINRNNGEKINILNLSQTCVPKNEKLIRAKQVTKATKVFTDWDLEKYFSGEAGDWIAANENSYGDCYLIRNDIFLETYTPV